MYIYFFLYKKWSNTFFPYCRTPRNGQTADPFGRAGQFAHSWSWLIYSKEQCVRHRRTYNFITYFILFSIPSIAPLGLWSPCWWVGLFFAWVESPSLGVLLAHNIYSTYIGNQIIVGSGGYWPQVCFFIRVRVSQSRSNLADLYSNVSCKNCRTLHDHF